MRGPQVTVSRTHPNLVRKLFALEVPEIADGSVEIVAVAREAGHRTKIAVRTAVDGLNAKGACIGPMGQRVRNVVAELHGEKIDIIDWAEDPATYVGNALSPAHVAAQRGRRPGRAVGAGRRARLPAVARHRPRGAERPPRRPAHRLADRHPQRRRSRGRAPAQRWRRGAGRATLAATARGVDCIGGRRRRRRQPNRSDRTGPTGPIRTCIGCRQRAAAAELLRVVVAPDATGRHSRTARDPAVRARRRAGSASTHAGSRCVVASRPGVRRTRAAAPGVRRGPCGCPGRSTRRRWSSTLRAQPGSSAQQASPAEPRRR